MSSSAMRSCYSIDIIGKGSLLPIPFGVRLPQYVIKTQAEEFKLPRIPASFCRNALQSPVHNGLIAVMLRCPATFIQEPPVGPRRSPRRRAWVIRNQNAHAGDRTRAAQGVAERSFRALHPAVAQAPMRAKIFAPDHPIFFLKPSTRLVGHLQPIVARTQNMGFHPIIYRRELAGMRRCRNESVFVLIMYSRRRMSNGMENCEYLQSYR